jgi:hypothetical protein
MRDHDGPVPPHRVLVPREKAELSEPERGRHQAPDQDHVAPFEQLLDRLGGGARLRQREGVAVLDLAREPLQQVHAIEHPEILRP